MDGKLLEKDSPVSGCIWIYMVLFLLFSTPVSAATWTLDDTYIGSGAPAAYGQNGGDVVSASGDAAINNFNIDQMIVTVSDTGEVEISIVTDYSSNILGVGTDYGDLFISYEPYSGDDFYDPDAVEWNYVIDTDTGAIYATSDGAFVSSDDMADEYGWSDGTYREGQLVGFEPGEDAQSVAEGEFDDSQEGLLIYAFDLEDLGLTEEQGYELAFRWSMTCANDIIQAGGMEAAPVPEPASMMLLGLGFLCLSALGRKTIYSV